MDYYYEHTGTLPLGGLKSALAQGSVKKRKNALLACRGRNTLVSITRVL